MEILTSSSSLDLDKKEVGRMMGTALEYIHNLEEAMKEMHNAGHEQLKIRLSKNPNLTITEMNQIVYEAMMNPSLDLHVIVKSESLSKTIKAFVTAEAMLFSAKFFSDAVPTKCLGMAHIAGTYAQTVNIEGFFYPFEQLQTHHFGVLVKEVDFSIEAMRDWLASMEQFMFWK